MATIYPAADTTLIRALLSNAEEASYPTPPEGAGAPFVFDHTTNAALVADLRRSTDAYRLASGVLTKSGAVVTPNPPDAAAAERLAATDNLRARAAAALARLDALNTDPTTTDTAAKVRQGLRDVAQIVHAMLRRDMANLG